MVDIASFGVRAFGETMASGDKKKRLSSNRVLWSLLLSTGIAAVLLLIFQFSNKGCPAYEADQTVIFGVVTVVWLIFSALFLLPWWGRLVLLLLSIGLAILILTTNIDRTGIAGLQASAVGRVRRIQELLEAYKEKHPREGYPPVMPMIGPNRFTDKTYNFEYVPIRAKKDGAAEDYVLRATPARTDCGCKMRLITSSERIIHWNFEDRPATNADPPIPQ